MNFNTLNTPPTFDSNKDFSTEITDFFSKYISFITPKLQILFTNGLITNDAKVSTESQLNDGVKILTDIFYEFDKGDNSKCYDLLRQLLILYKKILVSKEFFINLSRNTQLYRIRTDKLLPSDRNEYDLFHIPFRKRHLVSNLRFNPPGIPCLYCSSNLLTCYKEMKKDLKLFDTSELDSIANNSLNVEIFKNDIHGYGELYQRYSDQKPIFSEKFMQMLRITQDVDTDTSSKTETE